jgi:hypothetical protein
MVVLGAKLYKTILVLIGSADKSAQNATLVQSW